MTSPFIKGLMTEEELDNIVGITTSVVSDDYCRLNRSDVRRNDRDFARY